MGPIPSNAQEAARLQALMEDALSQRDYVDDILRNLPEFTRSGVNPANPRTSRAMARIPIPETTTIPNLPHTYGSANVPVHELVQQQAARSAEIEILRAAQALNAPLPANQPLPARPVPTGVRPTMAVGRMLNPLLAILQGMMFTDDLNKGEDEELAKRRATGYTGPSVEEEPRTVVKPDRN